MNLEQLPAYWIADLKKYLKEFRKPIEVYIKLTALNIEKDGYQITIHKSEDIDSILA